MCNFQSFLSHLIPPPLQCTTPSFISPPPPLQFLLVSGPSPHHLPFHFFLLRSSSTSPLTALNPCLFLHLSLSHTISFSLSLHPSFGFFSPAEPVSVHFLKFHSLQNTRSSLHGANPRRRGHERCNLPSS